MKVTIETNEEKEQEITFPCLMVSNENIRYKVILVSGITKEGNYKGVIIESKEESKYAIGYYSKMWNKSSFKPLPKGTKVILEN